jgi:NADPH2:quinone reductase
MNAVRVPRFGGPEVLELAALPDPVPGPGELLLDVRAAALNWSDLLQREGTYPGGPQPPFLAGQEAAGIVVAHGPGVTGPAPGTRVAAITGRGLHASRAAVPAATCFPLPASLSFEEGAALLVSLLTAGWALARLGRAVAGETAIIHAASGALGTTAVQVAKQLGLNVVATASTEARRARAAALGADVVCGYDDFDVAVRRVTGDRGADIVLDGVGGDVTRRSLSVLRPFGRLVVVGAASGEAPRLDPIKMIHSSVTVIGFHLRGLWRQPEVAREAVTEWLTWVESGAVQPQIDTVLPLADVRHAHERLAGRRAIGKIILTP